MRNAPEPPAKRLITGPELRAITDGKTLKFYLETILSRAKERAEGGYDSLIIDDLPGNLYEKILIGLAGQAVNVKVLNGKIIIKW